MKREIPVIEYKKELSYAEITLCLPGGSSLEDDKTLGFAHFCEHLAFKLRHEGQTIFEFASALGGSSNAFTSNDMIAFEINIQSKYVCRTIAFLEKLFEKSFTSISDADFGEERRVVLEEMAMYKDDPADNLHEELMHNMYSSHIYGRRILGEPDTVGTASKEDIADFWHSRAFNSPYLVLAGGYSEKISMKLDCCGAPRKGTLSPWEGRKRFDTSHKQNKCYFIAGWKLPPHNGKIEALLDMTSTIIYGMDSGRLYNELVYETNIFDNCTDAAECGVLGSSYIHLFAMPASKTEWRLRKWAEFWKNFRFTQSEVAKAREVLLSKEYFQSEGLGNASAVMSKSYLLFKDAEKLDKDYFYEFTHVTADDLNRFKDEYLGLDKAFIGITKSPRCTFDIDSFDLGEGKAETSGPASFELKKNGIKGFSRPLGGSSFVSGCIIKKGGMLMNLKSLPGSFKLANSSLFTSAAGMDFDETNAYLDKFGIKIKPINSNSYAGLKFEVRDSFADEAIEIVKRFFENEIKEEDFEKEKLNLLSDLSMMKEYPEYYIRLAANRELYGGTPWEFLPEGNLESVKNITIDDVRKVRETYMTRNSFVVALAGASDGKMAEKLLGCLPAKGKKLEPAPLPERVIGGETIKIPVRGKDQVYLAKIFRGPSHYDKDFDAMRFFEYYMSYERSPLFYELREKSGLVYTFSLSGSNTPVGGSMTFTAITSPEKVSAVKDAFERALDDVINGNIQEDRLNEIKNSMATSFARAVGRSSFHATNIAVDEVLGLETGRYMKQLEIIDSITPRMITDSVRKWMGSGRWILSGAV